MDGIAGRIKDDVSNAALSKRLVIKNLDNFFDVTEHCSESITSLKCINVLSLVKQLDKTYLIVLVYLVPKKSLALKFHLIM